jgi:methyl-accepting chemotaxis protein
MLKSLLPNRGANFETTQYIAEEIGTLSVSIAGVSGNIEDTSVELTEQAALLENAATSISQISMQSRETMGHGESSQQIAEQAVHVATDMTQRLKTVLAQASSLAESMQLIGDQLTHISERLENVQKVSIEIDTISQKTSLLSLNAAVEAARAGESGQGFRVVAGEFKELSEYTANATVQIGNSIEDLSRDIDALVEQAKSSVDTAKVLTKDAKGIEAKVSEIPSVLENVADNQRTIVSVNREMTSAVETLNSDINNLSDGVNRSVVNIQDASVELDALRSTSEKMIGATVKLGVSTADTKYINEVQKVAKRIQLAIEEGIRTGEVSEEDMFDRNYMDIPGTNPVQVETRYNSFLDKILPPIQEPLLEFSDRVVFCAAVDVNGYLPTHNDKFSHPQRLNDVAWNTANCRNRRIFNDRVGLNAGRNTEQFLLQAYRRDMGNDTFALMKDLSAPIYVNGKHWGGVRLAYRVQHQ